MLQWDVSSRWRLRQHEQLRALLFEHEVTVSSANVELVARFLHALPSARRVNRRQGGLVSLVVRSKRPIKKRIDAGKLLLLPDRLKALDA